jgi:uncharacterized glyoxalase superfamily protein PhnB
VSNLTIDQELATSSPEGGVLNTTVVPYLAVSGAEGALAWYVEAFGASIRGLPIVMPDGRIGHSEVDVGGGRFMLSEEHPAIGVSAPAPGSGASVTLVLTVAQVDALIERAVAAGARLERPPADFDYGRNGVIRDPFGHRWMIASEAASDARGVLRSRQGYGCADVQDRRHRCRRRARAPGGRLSHRPRGTALRHHFELLGRPGNPLLPRPAVSRRTTE